MSLLLISLLIYQLNQKEDIAWRRKINIGFTQDEKKF